MKTITSAVVLSYPQSYHIIPVHIWLLYHGKRSGPLCFTRGGNATTHNAHTRQKRGNGLPCPNENIIDRSYMVLKTLPCVFERRAAPVKAQHIAILTIACLFVQLTRTCNGKAMVAAHIAMPIVSLARTLSLTDIGVG